MCLSVCCVAVCLCVYISDDQRLVLAMFVYVRIDAFLFVRMNARLCDAHTHVCTSHVHVQVMCTQHTHKTQKICREICVGEPKGGTQVHVVVARGSSLRRFVDFFFYVARG